MLPYFNFQMLLTDIPTDHVYKLKVAGSTDSIFSYHSYIGAFSNEVEFELEGKPQQIQLAQLVSMKLRLFSNPPV